jgi:hypothetical protein
VAGPAALHRNTDLHKAIYYGLYAGICVIMPYYYRIISIGPAAFSGDILEYFPKISPTIYV